MNDKTERRIASRKKVETKVEFYVDADVIQAISIDVSKTGVRFETEQAVPIRLNMVLDGELYRRPAQLVWARRDDGKMNYGFEFIEAPEEDDF